jgi:hypothetical protein
MKHILAPILLFPSLALGQGLSGANWVPDSDGYGGSIEGMFGILVLGLIIGVTIQRIAEKRFGVEHGEREYDWFRTIVMSIWVSTPFGMFISLMILR